MKTHSKTNAAEDTRSEDIQVRLGTFVAIELDGGSDFVILELHKRCTGVSTAVKVSKNLKGFLVAVVVLKYYL